MGFRFKYGFRFEFEFELVEHGVRVLMRFGFGVFCLGFVWFGLGLGLWMRL